MVKDYLKRIKLNEIIDANLGGLVTLHKAHIMNVPFEVIDIHRKIPIILDLHHLQNKIIYRNRGGFCYELNYLFNELLLILGFNSKIISARIFDDDNIPGPEFDHMAIIVEIDSLLYLADIGFGDLFIRPLNILDQNIQKDQFHYFKIENLEKGRFCLLMSTNKKQFKRKYLFDLIPRSIHDFLPQCQMKQSSPASYFVKNKICTIPTDYGRKTLFNNKFLEKSTGLKKRIEVLNDNQESLILSKHFNIHTDSRVSEAI